MDTGLLLPANEASRQKALYACNILDTAQEPTFDRLTELAALFCQAPVVLINLVDANRVWSKSAFGMSRLDISRQSSMCQYVVMEEKLFEIPNLLEDWRFVDNPFVQEAPHIRFYAGQPLVLETGDVIGTICVIDFVPRTLTTDQWRALALLADEVSALIKDRAGVEAFESFFMLAPKLMGICSDVGELLQINECWMNTLGRLPEPHQGVALAAAQLYPGNPEAARQWWEAIQHASASAPLLAQCHNYAGGTSLIEWYAARSGHRLYLIGRDVTRLCETETSLVLQQEKLEQALAIANIGVWELDLTNNLALTLSPGCQALLGYSPQELTASRAQWRALIHPSDLVAAIAHFRAILTGQAIELAVELRMCRAQGYYGDFLIRGKLLRNPAGTPFRIVGTLVDISARKQAENRQKVSEAKLMASLEGTPNVAVQWYNAQGQVLYWNKASEQMYGWASEETLGKTLDQLIHTPQEAAGFLEILDQIASTGEVYGPYEAEILHRNGTKGCVLATTFAIPAEDERQVFVCMDVDISERKRIEQQLREKNAEQEQLIRFTRTQNDQMREYTYITSHNLRSPIASIMGLGMLLQTNPTDVHLLEMLNTSIQQLDITIRNMNDLLTIESERQTLAWATLLLADAVRNTQALLGPLIADHACMMVDIPGELTLHTIPVYLDSILNNLITNAIKYRKPNKKALIEISAHREEDAVVLKVADHGVGIDLEQQGHRLFKMNSRISMQVEGKGLGLFFTKYHVEAMGGKIAVDSTPGEGTIFTIWFFDPPTDPG